MDRYKLILIILGAMATGATIAAAYLAHTRYGRFLTIFGAAVAIMNAPSDTVAGAAISQAISHALDCPTYTAWDKSVITLP